MRIINKRNLDNKNTFVNDYTINIPISDEMNRNFRENVYDKMGNKEGYGYEFKKVLVQQLKFVLREQF